MIVLIQCNSIVKTITKQEISVHFYIYKHSLYFFYFLNMKQMFLTVCSLKCAFLLVNSLILLYIYYFQFQAAATNASAG